MSVAILWLSFLIGLPAVLLSGFARTYTIEGESLSSCFIVDIASWGPFCFAQGSIMPDIIVWGGRVLGLLLVFLGYLQARSMLREKIQQLGPPPDGGM